MPSLVGLDLITVAFGAFNTLRLFSYFPQIAAVARDNNGAVSISCWCWSIWVGANGSTALYAWYRLADVGLTAVSAFNATCCITVLALVAYKRLKKRGSVTRRDDVMASCPE